MNKKLAITVLCFVAIAIIGGWTVSKTQRVIIKHQQETIEVQKELKESLKNQVEYIKSLNKAFGKTLEMEKPETK